MMANQQTRAHALRGRVVGLALSALGGFLVAMVITYSLAGLAP